MRLIRLLVVTVIVLILCVLSFAKGEENSLKVLSAANLGPRVRLDCGGVSRTKQADKDACDLNLIMKKYVRTGSIDHFAKHGGEYGFASSVDFHSAMNVVVKADQMFEELPATVRRRCHNDPAEFLEFVQNPESREEMIELGLRGPLTEAEREALAPEAEAESAIGAPEVIPDAGVGDPAIEGS